MLSKLVRWEGVCKMYTARLRAIILGFVLVCALVSATAVYAADLFAPDWRGLPGTTFQSWDFTNSGDLMRPEVATNPYGQPLALPTGPWVPGAPGHFGWIRGEAGPAGMSFLIPNNPVANPEKIIRLQVTALPDVPSQTPILFGVTTPNAAVMTGNAVPLDNGWWLGVAEFHIVPNPASETVSFGCLNCGAWIDQVIIDTYCVPADPQVPEWPALALAAPALLGMLRLRRRR